VASLPRIDKRLQVGRRHRLLRRACGGNVRGRLAPAEPRAPAACCGRGNCWRRRTWGPREMRLNTCSSRPVSDTDRTVVARRLPPSQRQIRSPAFNSPAARRPPPARARGCVAVVTRPVHIMQRIPRLLCTRSGENAAAGCVCASNANQSHAVTWLSGCPKQERPRTTGPELVKDHAKLELGTGPRGVVVPAAGLSYHYATLSAILAYWSSEKNSIARTRSIPPHPRPTRNAPRDSWRAVSR